MKGLFAALTLTGVLVSACAGGASKEPVFPAPTDLPPEPASTAAPDPRMLRPDPVAIVLAAADLPRGFITSREVPDMRQGQDPWLRLDRSFRSDEPLRTAVSGALVAASAEVARSLYASEDALRGRYQLGPLSKIAPRAAEATPGPSPDRRATDTPALPRIDLGAGEEWALYETVTVLGFRGYLATWVQANVISTVIVVGDQALTVDADALLLTQALVAKQDQRMRTAIGSAPVPRPSPSATRTPRPAPTLNPTGTPRPSALGSVAPVYFQTASPGAASSASPSPAASPTDAPAVRTPERPGGSFDVRPTQTNPPVRTTTPRPAPTVTPP